MQKDLIKTEVLSEDIWPKNCQGVCLNVANYICQGDFALILNEISNKVLVIMLSNDKKMQVLNNQFFKKDYPTDVLSFSYWQEKNSFESFSKIDEEFLIGELIVSYEFTKKHASSLKNNMNLALIQFITHGMLHIFGFTHDNKKDSKKMADAENEIFNGLNKIYPGSDKLISQICY